MKHFYKTQGTCARGITVELDGDKIKEVVFDGGCNGNTKGIAELVKGAKVDEVIEKIKDIKCGFKNTSCPAELAKALQEAKKKESSQNV